MYSMYVWARREIEVKGKDGDNVVERQIRITAVSDKRRLQTCRLAGKLGKPCCGML